MPGKGGDLGQQGRLDRLIEERIHDPYMMRAKPSEPTRCPECGVVFQDGRWQWLTKPPEAAHEALCPACRRISDKVPAGFLTITGSFFDSHREELLNLVRNKVDAQKAQHPMKRIMDIEEGEEGGVVLTFTDVHLPRGVGEALASAYEGEFTVQYTENAGIVRAYWSREGS
jgi:NMD protein affecting ribosome stability and mRNA decay